MWGGIVIYIQDIPTSLGAFLKTSSMVTLSKFGVLLRPLHRAYILLKSEKN
jgi:hypothetical protein